MSLRIINTSAELISAFDNGVFDLTKWKVYIDTYVPGAKEMCIADMNDCINADFSWKNDFLPVLNAVLRDTDRREKTVKSFISITEHLEQKISDRFVNSLDVDIILYLGLCNGAGWVTTINGKIVVLLGIEKIMELNWCDTDAMTGLIVHEMGHVYQSQYGVLYRKTDSMPDQFLWQLFTEGVAMVFEQEIVGDPDYYHQDTNGWKKWCDGNAELIRQSFSDDMKHMTQENQRYFGDWVSFEGRGDTGYYLGTRFVRFLLEKDDFDHIINYDFEEVNSGFGRFLHSSLDAVHVPINPQA